MKKLLLLCFFFWSLAVVAQTTLVAYETVSPYSIVKWGNFIYIAEVNAHRISKIDITGTSTEPVILENITLSGPSSLAISGNELYISEFFGNKISKIDLTSSNPVLTDVVTGLTAPISITLNNNTLYIAERTANKISKINITDVVPVVSDVLTNVNTPRFLTNDGTNLFFSTTGDSQVRKITMSDTNPMPTLVASIHATGIEVSGDDFYFCEGSQNKISKINLSDAVPSPVDVVTGLQTPVCALVVGNELYFGEFTGNQISKISLALAVEQFSYEAPFIFPNPAKDHIFINNLDGKKNIQVFDTYGRIVLEQEIDNGTSLPVGNLAGGVYAIGIQNQGMLRFVKN